jgi:hypothetical protein
MFWQAGDELHLTSTTRLIVYATAFHQNFSHTTQFTLSSSTTQHDFARSINSHRYVARLKSLSRLRTDRHSQPESHTQPSPCLRKPRPSVPLRPPASRRRRRVRCRLSYSSSTLETDGSILDPNAPKRGLSAYMFFANEQRENVREENPGISFGMSISLSRSPQHNN